MALSPSWKPVGRSIEGGSYPCLYSLSSLGLTQTDFEVDTTGWTVSLLDSIVRLESDDAPTGRYVAKLKPDSSVQPTPVGYAQSTFFYSQSLSTRSVYYRLWVKGEWSCGQQIAIVAAVRKYPGPTTTIAGTHTYFALHNWHYLSGIFDISSTVAGTELALRVYPVYYSNFTSTITSSLYVDDVRYHVIDQSQILPIPTQMSVSINENRLGQFKSPTIESIYKLSYENEVVLDIEFGDNIEKQRLMNMAYSKLIAFQPSLSSKLIYDVSFNDIALNYKHQRIECKIKLDARKTRYALNGYYPYVDLGIGLTHTTGNPVLISTEGGFDHRGCRAPSIIRKDSIEYIFYGGITLGNKKQIGLAYREDYQSSFVKHRSNPVLTDTAHIEEPWVVKDPKVENNFYMVMTYIGTSNSIYSSSSSNLIDWTSPVPLLTSAYDQGTGGVTAYDTRHAEQPSLVYANGLWHLFYRGTSSAIISQHICHATSVDFKVWLKDPLNPVIKNVSSSWNQGDFTKPGVLWDGYIFRLYVAGKQNNKYKIGLYFSSDGSTWTQHENNPLLYNSGLGLDDDGQDAPFPYFLNGFLRFYTTGRSSTPVKESIYYSEGQL